MSTTPSYIVPDWPVPSNVKSLATTRRGGFSQPPYQGLNLGDHVDDSPQNVLANRQCLNKQLGDQVHCQWLQQVHGIDIIEASSNSGVVVADGATTAQQNLACVVMTADCLPVLFCDKAGRRVAAAHAGWRGLANGVLEAAVAQFSCPASDILCWFGPAIGRSAFEVGSEVREQFVIQHQSAEDAFIDKGNGKWFADIYQLAKLRLSAIGITAIYGGDFCTYSDEERFFSYRRDGVTGRMASLIWLSDHS